MNRLMAIGLCLLLSACGKHAKLAKKHGMGKAPSPVSATPALSGRGMESILVLRSIRESRLQRPTGCAAARTGFEPYATDGERHFSFWAVETSAKDGRVIDASTSQVAVLRGCFGPTPERTRQHFHADIELGALTFRGRGECVALAVDVPERGLTAVRCHLVLTDLPNTYTGGLLTTNTLTSEAAYGGETTPAGYTQASIATLRLWRAR